MKPCLKCDYDLTGLPREHTCPECGFAYDPLHLAIDLRHKPTRSEILTSVTVLLAPAPFLFFGPWQNIALRWALLWNPVVITGVLFFRWRARRKLKPKLILNRLGIHVLRSFHDVEFWPWKLVYEATCTFVSGSLTVQNEAGYEVFSLPVSEIGKLKTGKQCAAEIMRLKELYAADEEGGGRCDS